MRRGPQLPGQVPKRIGGKALSRLLQSQSRVMPATAMAPIHLMLGVLGAGLLFLHVPLLSNVLLYVLFDSEPDHTASLVLSNINYSALMRTRQVVVLNDKNDGIEGITRRHAV